MARWILVTVCFAASIAPSSAQEWHPVTEALIRAEKPGYGNLCGIAVDHQTGHVIINLSDKGFYRSTDACKSWQRLGMPFKGRTEWPGCLMLDPSGGKRLVSALSMARPLSSAPTAANPGERSIRNPPMWIGVPSIGPTLT